MEILLFFVIVYNSSHGYTAEQCAQEISKNSIPVSTVALDKCKSIKNSLDSVNTYRRLLPAQYADGLYKVIII